MFTIIYGFLELVAVLGSTYMAIATGNLLWAEMAVLWILVGEVRQIKDALKEKK